MKIVKIVNKHVIQPATTPGGRLATVIPFPTIPRELVPEYATPDDNFDPVQIVVVDVADPLPPLVRGTSRSGRRYLRARMLVRLHGMPLGVVWLDLESELVEPAALASAIDAALDAEITAHLQRDGFRLGVDGVVVDPRTLVHGLGGVCRGNPRLPDDTPLVSVVLATRGRPASLPLALDALLRSDHPNFEIVVVDNSPADGRTADLVAQRYAEDARVRLVAEPRPGLSRARNRGLSSARADIVAFTDDDVTVDPAWLRWIAAEFADGAVACVTGLVEPAELETVSQWWFECGAGFGRGMQRIAHRLDGSATSALFPYQLGIYGTGASMALRRSSLPPGWTFDEALGAGSACDGGEDIDLFLDVLLSGKTLVYQPAALSHHRHQADGAGLRRQMRGYGRGLTALMAKRLLHRPAERRLLMSKLLAGLRHALGPDFRSPSGDTVQPAGGYPRSLLVHEMRGMLEGPISYLAGARKARNRRSSRINPMVAPNGRNHTTNGSLPVSFGDHGAREEPEA